MPFIKPKLWQFYVEGRRDRILKNSIEVEDLAQTIMTGNDSLRDAIQKVCATVASSQQIGRVKKVWIEENKDRIEEAGGSSEEAYSAYLHGRVDELAYALESDVVNEIESEEDEIDDDDEEDDDDEDDDGE